MTTSDSKTVGVVRSEFLLPSETFVREHIVNLAGWRPVALYELRAKASLSVPDVDQECLFPPEEGPPDFIGFLKHGLHPRLSGIIARQRIQLIHAHFLHDGARIINFARRNSLPLIITAHGYDATIWPDSQLETREGRLTQFNIRAMTSYPTIVCVSDFIRNELIGRGYPADRLVTIRLGVRPETFAPEADFSKRRGALFVGRLVEKKGADLLIDAWSRLPEAIRDQGLTIIGGGDLRPGLEARAASLGQTVTFLGQESHEEIARRMALARVVVIPSIRAANGDAEGMCVVAMEAQASGAPVVMGDCGPAREAIAEGRSGLLARDRDPDDLARQLHAVLTQDDLAAALGRQGPLVARERFDLLGNLKSLESLYDEVAAQGGARAG
jgi:colanic acid/amylovoran biosynthesis glycosyltransferase